jgi:hypothetical protein
MNHCDMLTFSFYTSLTSRVEFSGTGGQHNNIYASEHKRLIEAR